MKVSYSKKNNMKLLSQTNIGGLELKNRIVRSATASFLAKNNSITQEIINIYQTLATANIGLIIFEDTSIEGINVDASHLVFDNDSHISSYKKITESAHENNSSIIMQLSHSGSFIKEEKLHTITENYSEEILDIDTLNHIIELFGQTALRAKKSGFDGVQIHCAHGYFLTKFLSPIFNQRKDKYGGSIQNRTQFIVDILKEIKIKCGKDFPVFMKLNSSDYMENNKGNTLSEAIEIAKIMDKANIDAIEVSGGTFYGQESCARNKILKPEDEAYHLNNALMIASNISSPIILVGGLRSPQVINSILTTYPQIDAVALARPFISEPHLVNKWINNDTKSKCVSCNKCFNPNGITCVLNRKK